MKTSNLIALFGVVACCLTACGGGGGTTSVAGSTALVSPATTVPADVSVPVNGPEVVYSAGVVTIAGTGFGTKAAAAPVKFTDFDGDTVGQVPAGWDAPQPTDSLVSSAMSHSGNLSLDSSAIGQTSAFFPKISWDMGQTIPFNGTLYLSAWVYLDSTGTTATGWNWKGPIITSGTDPYYWEVGTTDNVAAGFAGFYNQTESRWFNTAATFHYSEDHTAISSDDDDIHQNGWPDDAFIFQGWQRVEWIFKTNSALDAKDGSIVVTRIGRSTPTLQVTGLTTYGNTSNLWRYVTLPQGFTNIENGTLNLQMYFDDVYIDNTQARVEVGNSPDFNSCSHREIQHPISWSDTEVQVDFRKGSFNSGDTVYFFVINDQGTVVHTSAGFRVP